MIVKRIPAGIYAANCYIVMDEETKDAVLIDIGGDEDDVIEVLEDLGAKPVAILLTHGHVDHVSGVTPFKKKYDIPVYLNEKDEKLMLANTYIYGNFGPGKKADFGLNEGDELTFGAIKVKVVETPGHTPGGVCLLIDNYAFTGDTLFYGSVGRSDLTGGDHVTLINNIKEKLMVLPEDMHVASGHGPMSTIGKEKVGNPFIR